MPYVGLINVQRVRIIALTEQGMLQRDVAEIVGVTQGVVSKTYARYLELGTHKDRPIQIRQRVTTEQQDRLVC